MPTLFPAIFMVMTLVAKPMVDATPISAYQETYDQITAQMADIRGLTLEKPIPVEVKTRAELQNDQQSSLTDYPVEDQANDLRVFVAFGLVDPGIDLGQLYVDLYGEQVAGYYDSDTGDMVVVASSDGSEMSAMDKATFAHETVHGLQDQHFDLSSFNDQRLNGTSDTSLSITAMIEGDATVAELDYLMANPDIARSYLDELNSGDVSSNVFDSAPAIISQTLIFPYVHGQEFIQALYDEGGWDAVNAAYASPPLTTEQILHPDKYLAGEAGIMVANPDLESALGTGWTTIDTDTMGEFQVSLLLGDNSLKESQVTKASEGWGGDAFTICTNGDKTVVAWDTEWDSNADADQFARALAIREADRLGAETSSDGDVVTIASDTTVVRITTDGSRVIYLQAPDMETLNQAASATK